MTRQALKVFDRLLSSGFPITWTTIFIAWQRLPCVPGFNSTLITSEQLHTYAMDQIGYSAPEHGPFIVELAFSNEQDTWTILRCLQNLASDTPEEVQNAYRLWRWILLNEVVANLENAKSWIDLSARIGVWEDDFTTAVYCNLGDFRANFEFPSHGFAVTEDCQKADWFIDMPSTLRLIEEHRHWLIQEAEFLHK